MIYILWVIDLRDDDGMSWDFWSFGVEVDIFCMWVGNEFWGLGIKCYRLNCVFFLYFIMLEVLFLVCVYDNMIKVK